MLMLPFAQQISCFWRDNRQFRAAGAQGGIGLKRCPEVSQTSFPLVYIGVPPPGAYSEEVQREIGRLQKGSTGRSEQYQFSV